MHERSRWARVRVLASLPLAVAAAACADQLLAPRAEVPQAPAVALMECTVRVQTASMSCTDPGPGTGAARGVIYGGQGHRVRLANTAPQVTSIHPDTLLFSTDVTVQNLLLTQAIGTVDGVSPDSNDVRIFYFVDPVVSGGTGFVVASNTDGQRTFLNRQAAFYQYSGIIAADSAVSAARTWSWKLATTVQTFTFKVYVSTAVQARLVINEIMPNPGGTVQDSVGEYVELYNAGAFTADLQGFILRDNTAGRADTIKTSVTVPAGGYLLLGRSANTSKNGGITPDYLYTSVVGSTSTSYTFSNSGSDFFVVKAPTGVTVDSVFYTSGTTTAVAGVARELENPALDNTLTDGSNWGAATPFYDNPTANKGTPKQQNSVFTP